MKKIKFAQKIKVVLPTLMGKQANCAATNYDDHVPVLFTRAVILEHRVIAGQILLILAYLYPWHWQADSCICSIFLQTTIVIVIIVYSFSIITTCTYYMP